MLEEDGEEGYEHEGDNAKTKIYSAESEKLNNKTWTSVPIDRHGNADYSGGDGDSFTREAPEQAPQYGLYGSNIQNNLNTANEQWERAHQANQQLNEMLQRGEITAADHQQYTTLAGQYAGAAKTMAYENQLAKYEHERQHQHAYSWLEQQFPEEMSRQNRDNTLRETAEWMQSQGLSRELLMDVEDPNIIAVAVRTMKALENEKTNRLENAALKQKVRQLNKELGRGKKKAERGRELGQRRSGPVGESQLEQITDLLFGSDK